LDIGAIGHIDPKAMKIDAFIPEDGTRVGTHVAMDGKGALWTVAQGKGAMRFEPASRKWQMFANPIPGQRTCGMAGDQDGNGWWSMYTQEAVVKGELATGRASLVEIPKLTNSKMSLFTEEERKIMQDIRPDFFYGGRGKLDSELVRRTGADRRGR